MCNSRRKYQPRRYNRVMKTVTICSSASFNRQVIDVQAQLEKAGLRVLIPANAEEMKQKGDFEVSHYKTWFENADDYHKKSALIRGHFAEVEKGDAILVLNYEKHDTDNYIGGNVLMEMTVAFYLNKPIFILNDAPKDSAYLEEILGLEPVFLKGDLGRLVGGFEKLVEQLRTNQIAPQS